MLNIFKNFNPQTLVFLLIFTILIKLGFWINPTMPYIGEDEWAFGWMMDFLINIFGQSPYFFAFLGLINLVFQAFIINRLTTEYKIFSNNSFVPAAVFLLITSLNPNWNTINAPQIATWMMLIAFNNMLRLTTTSTPRKLLYNTGLAISVGMLFYYPFIFFLLAAIWSIAVIRPFKANDYLVLSIGFLTVPYFVVCIFYLLNLDFSIFKIDFIAINLPPQQIGIHFIANILILLILGIVSTFLLKDVVSKMVMNSKLHWWVIFIFLIISNIVALINVNESQSGWFFALVPASILISYIWLSDCNRWMKIVLFWLLIMAVIYIQWFPDQFIFKY